MINYRKVARIELTGKTTEDLLFLLDLVKTKISEDFITGSDSNNSASYDFSVTHEL